MIETIPTIPQPLQARVAYAAITLAKYEAEKAVEQALRGQGLKPQYIARREIVTAAKAYLAERPELIAEAKLNCRAVVQGGLLRQTCCQR